MDKTKEESESPKRKNVIDNTTGDGMAFIVPDQPIEDIIKQGFINRTPEVNKQIAYHTALSAMSHFKEGALEEAAERCRQALVLDRTCQLAQACELAILRRNGKRKFADDLRQFKEGSINPFIVGLSYFAEKEFSNNCKNEDLSRVAENFAGFFFWHSVKQNPGKAFPLTNLGASLIDIGASIAAEDILKQALKIDSMDYYASSYLGSIYHFWGMFAEALKCYELSSQAGMTENSQSINTLKIALTGAINKIKLARNPRERGMIMWIMGKYQEAYDSLMEDAPNLTDPKQIAIAGHCKRIMGQYSDANNFFRLSEKKGWSDGAALAIQCTRDSGSLIGALALAEEYHDKYADKLPDISFFAAELYYQNGNILLANRAIEYLFKCEMIIDGEKKGFF